MTAWSVLASVIELVANLGAGAASWFLNYEPETPEILRK